MSGQGSFVPTISIHALREEGDVYQASDTSALSKFLSTPSARRATLLQADSSRASRNFYPRPPRGGRPLACTPPKGLPQEFLSTPSARRATMNKPMFTKSFTISIHALREEGDRTFLAFCVASCYFYPRPPRGGRRYAPSRRCLCNAFLSTPSARRATHRSQKQVGQRCNFYPRPPRGGRRQTSANKPSSTKFLSTPSARRAT